MASMNSMSFLAKARPTLVKIVMEALVTWTPAALAGQPASQVRNVEKTLRIIFIHFHRSGLAGSHAPQINDALRSQQQRMEAAAAAEWERKEREAKRKRDSINEGISQAEKRRRGDESGPVDIYSNQSQIAGPSSMPQEQQGLSGVEGARAFCRAAIDDSKPNPLAAFDVTTLPLALVIELILANLQAVPDADIHRAIERVRSRLEAPTAAQHAPPQRAVPPSAPPPGPPPVAPIPVKEEEQTQVPVPAPVPQNPLKEDIEDEDLRKLDGVNAGPADAQGDEDEGEEGPEDALAALEDFELLPPEPFSQTEAKALIKESVARMCDMGGQAAVFSAQLGDEVPEQTLWATLVTRLASRGFDGADDAEEEDSSQGAVAGTSLDSSANMIRQMMLDFLKVDLSRRIPFAIEWLSEEWFCDLDRRKRGKRPCYEHWLQRVVDVALQTIDAKGKPLATLLAELPSIPDIVVDQVATLCHEKARMAVGFTSLRDLAATRPPSRAKAVELLLSLSKSSDKSLRAPAIITVRGWVGSGGPLEGIVLQSARDSLQRLTVRGDAGGEAPPAEKQEQDGIKTEGGEEDGALAPEDQRDPVKDETFQVRDENHVLQFVELPFALSVKVPDMLNAVFDAYPSMPEEVQKAVQKHIAALVRSLGPNNQRLLHILKTFPAGSDTLALSVFNIMAEKGRTQMLLSTVKTMVTGREVDPHFLIPILPSLGKADIIKLVPRAVTILNSKLPEDRNALKALFASIVTKPAQGFGSVSTNLPRVRDSEMLTPVELMGVLHSAEKEIGLKTTVDAIRICFSMTDVFRSEVLAAALNQLVEEPDLPVLFMRTAIMAVSTYRSLAGYVSSNLLSRLIVKKVWQNKLLWDGFVLCVEQTAPGSFAALLQLPQEQLLDVVQRKPALKEGLRSHLEKKVGNPTRLAAYLELLEGAGAGAGGKGGEGEGTPGPDSATSTPQPQSQPQAQPAT